jgi:uncharacterized protein YjbI with pentapeptide repeats
LNVRTRWSDWPRSIRGLAVGVAAVVVLAAASWWLLVPAADWLARHDVGSASGPVLQTAEDAARGRLLTLGAGLFAAGALLFTARNFALSREGQVTDRYTKAIEQLGSDKLDIRIGGIYALERVALDSARDHPAVMEVLTAFIREHSQERWPPPGPDGQERERLTRPDVQAAATVVGRRNARHDVRMRVFNLSGAILPRAFLPGANLSRANLSDADLSGATLVRADLTGTILQSTNLKGAHLEDAHLKGAFVSDAILTQAILPRANLEGATFGNVDLTQADLSNAILCGATFASADLSGATLVRADLTGAILTTSVILTGTSLNHARWTKDPGVPVPDGWELDTRTGWLLEAGRDPGVADPYA